MVAYGNVYAKGSTDSYSRNGGLVDSASESATISDCYRSKNQSLTRYNYTGAYCGYGTSASPETIETYISAKWNSKIWLFDKSYPRFVEN